MTVATTDAVKRFTGDGAQTLFSVNTFGTKAKADIEVSVDDVVQTLDTDYTIDNLTETSFDINFTTAPANLTTITAQLNLPLTQATDYIKNDDFAAETHEAALDKLTRIAQQLAEVDLRSFKLSPKNTGTVEISNTATQRANQLLSFDASGNLTSVDAASANLVTLANAVKAINDLTDGAAGKIIRYTGTTTAELLDVMQVVNKLTSEGAPAASDEMGIFDLSASAGRKMTLQAMLKVINVLGQDATPDEAADKLLTYDDSASNVKRVSPETIVGRNQLDSDGTLAPHKNLVVKNGTTAASQVTVTADGLIVTDSNGAQKKLASVNEADIDITVSGAGGLDTGAEAASTWYHIWIIAKADGTVAGLLSVSSTAPTMPTGYTFKGYVGAVRNDGANNFLDFRQVNRHVAQEAFTEVSAGSATAYTALSPVMVPPTAKVWHGDGEITNNAGANAFIKAFVAALNSPVVGETYIGASVVTGGLFSGGFKSVVLQVAQTIHYKVDASNRAVQIRTSGWEF